MVIPRFRKHHDQYFWSFSYFPDFFLSAIERQVKETRKTSAILYEISMRLVYRKRAKHLLSVN